MDYILCRSVKRSAGVDVRAKERGRPKTRPLLNCPQLATGVYKPTLVLRSLRSSQRLAELAV
jgi:hypothetical protein